VEDLSFEKAFWDEVVERADSLIIVLDLTGKIILFNPKAEDTTGYRAKDVVGRSWVELFVPPEYQAGVQKRLSGLIEGRRMLRLGKYPILSKHGKRIPISWDRSFVRGNPDRRGAILSIGHALSPEQLIEEERYYTKSVLDSIAEGVVAVDLDFRISSFNKSATKITGFAEDQALGQYCCDILRSSLCSRCPLKAMRSSGEDSINMDADILNKENKEIPVSLRITLRKDANENVMGGILAFRDLTSIVELKKELQEKYSFQDIISKNKHFLEMFRILPDIARSDAAVLITGESGTGKELIAAALHQLSDRREKPFIKVNCGALPETLLESELFGYKRGAFTDAKQDKPGRFKLAEHGSIFLDEIGELSLGTQVKLLRVLENKEYEPLGGTRTEKADVRIISATNRNLWPLVQAGKFREDLYYRLNLFTMEIPPLRDRPEDIPLLIDHFLARFNSTKGKTVVGFTQSAMEILLNHAYPGNVRELQNIIEHAFILCKTSSIGPECLPLYLQKRSFPVAGARGRKAVREFEKELILSALRRHGGKVHRAAKEMGVHRATLWRKMKKINAAAPDSPKTLRR
jgi:PAS domain S-box-containing protein